MATGKIRKRVVPSSVPFKASDYLKSDRAIAAYIEGMLEDGDVRLVPIALRTVAEAVGGMAVLAERTGLSRETLYRTLSKNGNPRLGTLMALLNAFGLRLSVRAVKSRHGSRHAAST
jgi:probable addiction module antidote protein